MRFKKPAIILLICLLSPCLFLLNKTYQVAKKKVILAQRKVFREATIEKGKFDEKNYDDLCYVAFYYLADAIIKKDLGDSGYKKDFESALGYYDKAVVKDKEQISAYKGLFFVYDFMGDEKKAVENIKVAIEKNENDFDSLFILGNFYYKKADYKNAIVWLSKAEQLAEADLRLYGDGGRKGFKKLMSKVKAGLKQGKK